MNTKTETEETGEPIPVISKDLLEWISVRDKLPETPCKVVAIYAGVYGSTLVRFWRDLDGNPHFGYPASQPATHWYPIPFDL